MCIHVNTSQACFTIDLCSLHGSREGAQGLQRGLPVGRSSCREPLVLGREHHWPQIVRFYALIPVYMGMKMSAGSLCVPTYRGPEYGVIFLWSPVFDLQDVATGRKVWLCLRSHTHRKCLAAKTPQHTLLMHALHQLRRKIEIFSFLKKKL